MAPLDLEKMLKITTCRCCGGALPRFFLLCVEYLYTLEKKLVFITT